MAARALAAVAAVAAAVFTAISTLVPVAGAASDPAGGVGLWALRSGDFDAATEPGRYSTVVLNTWEAARIPSLREANPHMKILMYKDMASTRSYAVRDGVDDALLPTGVGYAYADLLHPEWFLTDTTGGRIEWKVWPHHWWMDIGNPDYQRLWADNVSRELAAGGWDGVAIDNAMTSPRWYLRSGQTIAKYPDDTSYQAATESFLAAVGHRLKEEGRLVVPNLGGNVPSLDLYRRWLSHTSGMMREFWSRWGDTGTSQPITGWDWDHQMALLETVEQAGKLFLGVTYGEVDDRATMTYARASFLLGWSGSASSIAWTSPRAGVDPWATEWTRDVGMPLAPREQVNGGWKRRFTSGVVVVNPSNAAITVPLGGTYRDMAGANVSSVSLAPATAAILASSTSGGEAPLPDSPTAAPSPSVPTASAPTPKPGYRVLGVDGGIFSYGAAPFHGSVPGLGIRTTTVSLASTPAGNGYWVLGSDGGVFTFGDGRFFGSVPGLGLTGVQGIDLKATPTGNGYWVLGADGGVFTFGDARFFGSLPGIGVANRAIALVPTRSGNGYWVLGADGGVFSFGDAGFFGSVPGLGIRTTSVSMAATPSGRGYWVLGRDGGVFTFGDAPFHGSVPALGISVPGVKIAGQQAGTGYYVLGEAGQVFAFGAPALGDPAALGVRGRDLSVIG